MTESKTTRTKRVYTPVEEEAVVEAWAETATADEDAPAVAPDEAIYVVSSDTWGKIAQREGVDARAIAEANGMTIHSLLYVGPRLKRP